MEHSCADEHSNRVTSAKMAWSRGEEQPAAQSSPRHTHNLVPSPRATRAPAFLRRGIRSDEPRLALRCRSTDGRHVDRGDPFAFAWGRRAEHHIARSDGHDSTNSHEDLRSWQGVQVIRCVSMGCTRTSLEAMTVTRRALLVREECCSFLHGAPRCEQPDLGYVAWQSHHHAARRGEGPVHSEGGRPAQAAQGSPRAAEAETRRADFAEPLWCRRIRSWLFFTAGCCSRLRDERRRSPARSSSRRRRHDVREWRR